MLTIEGLQSCCTTTAGKARAPLFAALLAEVMPIWGITTPARQAMFIAQALHESGEFQWLAELGNKAYFEKYDTGTLAKTLGNTPEADGDGFKYKGRGIFQTTGLYNYEQTGKVLKIDLVNHPELLEEPRHAVASACYYWFNRKLNRFADVGAIKDCTKAINGGYTHLAEREAYWVKAKKALAMV